jgi:hypothetical protein
MESPGSRPYRLPRFRWLLPLSLVFVAIAVLDAIVSTEAGVRPLSWRGWARFGAVPLLYFWFAILVIASEERNWFPSRRRLAHAVAFGVWSTASALLVYAPASALPAVFLVSLPIGYFAASRVEWLSP